MIFLLEWKCSVPFEGYTMHNWIESGWSACIFSKILFDCISYFASIIFGLINFSGAYFRLWFVCMKMFGFLLLFCFTYCTFYLYQWLFHYLIWWIFKYFILILMCACAYFVLAHSTNTAQSLKQTNTKFKKIIEQATAPERNRRLHSLLHHASHTFRTIRSVELNNNIASAVYYKNK